MFQPLLLKLKKSSHLVKNSGWNLLGQILPLISALICIPLLINLIGNERFGFLAIAWMVIGYFSLFDFGLGRAITYAVSKKNSEGKNSDTIIITAFKFLFIIAMIVTLGFYFIAELLVTDVLKVSDELKPEAVSALQVLSLGLPFVILTIGIRGVLEANQAFKKISLVSIPSGLLLYVAPTISAYFTNSLVVVFFSLVFVRLFQFSLFLYIFNNTNKVNWSEKFSRIELTLLLRFGSWMTVTNIISPIMVNLDRFFIGAKLSVATVTYYVVPFDMITKASIIPSSISGVLFPEFAKYIGSGRTYDARKLLKKGMLSLGVIYVLPLLIVCVFASEILSYWISTDFSVKSTPILQILCLGVFINGLAYLPFAYIQGAGRSDITAKIHFFELLLYVPLLYFFIAEFGLIGAAITWCLRVLLDLLLLVYFSFFRELKK